ncbi:MAG TPA: M15 family metallopeptidase [Acidimicrobiales bacterium]|jgi:hypothetical protein
MESNDDRGQAALFLVAAVGLTTVLLFGLTAMGRVVTNRAQARTAADAAALAGAAGAEPAARALAEANGAELAEYHVNGDEVVVKVVIDGVDAFGRARRWEVPTTSATGTTVAGGGDREGLAPAMVAALAIADRLLGRPVPVVSGYRSRAEQESLWERRASNPYPVAQPGRSRHESGLAVDVPSSFIDQLLSVAPQAGLCRPLPVADPIHFEVC